MVLPAAIFTALLLFFLWARSPVVRAADSRAGRCWAGLDEAGAVDPNPDMGLSAARPNTGAARHTSAGPQAAAEPPAAARPGGLGAPATGDAGDRGAAEDGFSIAVLTYNVGFASGMANNRPILLERETGRRNLRSIMSLLAVDQPDIVALQEVDGLAKRSFYVDQPRELARACALAHGCFAPNWNKRYVPFPTWPPKVHYGPIFSGLAVLSRYPVVGHEIVPLPQPPNWSLPYRALYLERVVQVARIRIPTGETIVVLNVHLEPFDTENRHRHAEIVADLCREWNSRPLLVLGDCNAPPSFATDGDRFGGDSTISILTSGTGLRSVFDRTRYLRDEAGAFTFPADAPSVTLDYVFYNDAFELEGSLVVRRNAGGSDHLPVAARLRLVGS